MRNGPLEQNSNGRVQPTELPIQEQEGTYDLDGLESLPSVNGAQNPGDVAQPAVQQQEQCGFPVQAEHSQLFPSAYDLQRRHWQTFGTGAGSLPHWTQIGFQRGHPHQYAVPGQWDHTFNNRDAVSASPSMGIDYRSQSHIRSTSWQSQGFHNPNYAVHGQSVSGFSDLAINDPPGGHLQQLPSVGSYHLPLNRQTSNMECSSQQAGVNCIVADPYVSSTHDALRRDLRSRLGQTTYEEHRHLCYNSAIAVGKDHVVAVAYADHLLYYPSIGSMIKCSQCQNQHDDSGATFQHAETCPVRHSLMRISNPSDDDHPSNVPSFRQPPGEASSNGEDRTSGCDDVRAQLLSNNVTKDVIDSIVKEYGMKSLGTRSDFFKYLDLKEKRQKEKNARRRQIDPGHAAASGVARPERPTDTVTSVAMLTRASEEFCSAREGPPPMRNMTPSEILFRTQRDQSSVSRRATENASLQLNNAPQTENTEPKTIVSAGRNTQHESNVTLDSLPFTTANPTSRQQSLANYLPYETVGAVNTPPQIRENDTSVRIKHPQYSDQQVRLRSFANWPASHIQTPERLAETGLLYDGFLDRCRCFTCGGVLREWDADDDPWVEHARWFPNCSYVKEMKGSDFIGVVQHMAKKRIKDGADKAISAPAQHLRNVVQLVGANGLASLSLEESGPPDSVVDQVIQMGFSKEEVQSALRELQGRVPDRKHVYTAEEIIAIILHKQDREKALPTGSIRGSLMSPSWDPKMCGCRKGEVCATQYLCGHIVCKNCVAKKDSEGKYRCGICKREVTEIVTFDNSAFEKRQT